MGTTSRRSFTNTSQWVPPGVDLHRPRFRLGTSRLLRRAPVPSFASHLPCGTLPTSLSLGLPDSGFPLPGVLRLAAPLSGSQDTSGCTQPLTHVPCFILPTAPSSRVILFPARVWVLLCFPFPLKAVALSTLVPVSSAKCSA